METFIISDDSFAHQLLEHSVIYNLLLKKSMQGQRTQKRWFAISWRAQTLSQEYLSQNASTSVVNSLCILVYQRSDFKSCQYERHHYLHKVIVRCTLVERSSNSCLISSSHVVIFSLYIQLLCIRLQSMKDIVRYCVYTRAAFENTNCGANSHERN